MYDFDFESDSTSTVFRDVILLALAGFVAIVLLLLPHVNPPKQNENKDVPPPGNMMVQIFWDDKSNMDIDLWVKAPNDSTVGYSSKSGKIFNLLRDDLGHSNDTTERNFEIAVTRGVIQGEYTINLMFYRDARIKKTYPVNVHVIVSYKKADKLPMKIILEKKYAKLHRVHEEITVFNFILDQHLDLDKESVNDFYKPLAGARAPTGTGGP